MQHAKDASMTQVSINGHFEALHVVAFITAYT
jgi:hypothetical protein